MSGREAKGWAVWARALLVLLAIWLILPAFHASQIEGFSANISALALRFGPGAPAAVFPDMAAQGEYIYFTRIGVVMLIRGIGLLTGHYGGGAFLGLMLASFAVFAGSTIAVTRRYAGVGWELAVAALLLIPGAIDTAFFFNDNMPSAAFAVLALALAAWCRSLAAYAVAGALIGFAILCRTDAVFAVPMLAGLCWLELRRPGPILVRAAVSAGAAVALFVLVWTLAGVSPLDALRIGPQFITGNARLALYRQPALIGALLGLPGLILFTLGAATGAVRRRGQKGGVAWVLVLLAYPLLAVVVFALRTSVQVRHFYPLMTPFLAVHIATALAALGDRLRRGERRGIPAGLFAFCALVTLLPPGAPAWAGLPVLGYGLLDGPRSILIGRFWMPLYWLRWQSAQRAAVAGAEALAAEAEANPSTLIVTAHYDDEAYLKLGFLEAGWQIGPAGTAFADCAHSAVVLYRKAGHDVFLVRTDNQYGKMPMPIPAAAALLVTLSRSCSEAWASDRAVLTMMGRPDRIIAPGPREVLGIFAPVGARLGTPAALSATLAPAELPLFGDPFALRPAGPTTPPGQSVRLFHALPLSPAERAAIAAEAAREATGTRYGFADFAATYGSIRKRGSGA